MACRYHIAFKGMCDDSNSTPEIQAFFESVNCGKNCGENCGEKCDDLKPSKTIPTYPHDIHFIMHPTIVDGQQKFFVQKTLTGPKLEISEDLYHDVWYHMDDCCPHFYYGEDSDEESDDDC